MPASGRGRSLRGESADRISCAMSLYDDAQESGLQQSLKDSTYDFISIDDNS